MKFDDKTYLAEKIRYYRKKSKLTQSELAKRVGLTEQHISRIESGCYIPSLKSFFMLVDVLDIDLKEFGFYKKIPEDSVKNKLIDKIINSDERELILYDEVIEALHNGLLKIH